MADAGLTGSAARISAAGADEASPSFGGGNGADRDKPLHQAASLEWPGRTALGGELKEQDVGRRVTLCGWVHRHRNMGGLVFSDLRDHSGIIQVPQQVEAKLSCHLLSPGLRCGRLSYLDLQNLLLLASVGSFVRFSKSRYSNHHTWLIERKLLVCNTPAMQLTSFSASRHRL